jgi:hypothetical protein
MEKKTEKKSLESWARKADEFFDNKEVEQFLWYCEDERFISRSKMVTEKTFRGLMAGFGY